MAGVRWEQSSKHEEEDGKRNGDEHDVENQDHEQAEEEDEDEDEDEDESEDEEFDPEPVHSNNTTNNKHQNLPASLIPQHPAQAPLPTYRPSEFQKMFGLHHQYSPSYVPNSPSHTLSATSSLKGYSAIRTYSPVTPPLEKFFIGLREAPDRAKKRQRESFERMMERIKNRSPSKTYQQYRENQKSS